MMNVAQWMESVEMPWVTDAEKYTIGQDLTGAEALDIKRYLEYCVLSYHGAERAYGMGWLIPQFHIEQMDLITDLLWHPDVSADSNWTDALLETLDEDEMDIVHEIMHDVFAERGSKKRKISVAKWLQKRGLPYLKDGAKYWIGQNLTAEEATELKIYISNIVAAYHGCTELHSTPEVDPQLYHDVVSTILDVIWAPSIPEYSNWRSALWNTFTNDDLRKCHEILRGLRIE